MFSLFVAFSLRGIPRREKIALFSTFSGQSLPPISGKLPPEC